MRAGTQAMLGGVFMILVDRAASLAFGAEFSFFLAPLWFIGAVVFMIGGWMRLQDL